jgi:hypothetical protein
MTDAEQPFKELPYGWTILRTEYGPEMTPQWHGYNTKTGERLRPEQSYDAALAVVRQRGRPQAEPWGV